MAVDVLMPQLGMLMTEGTLVQWFIDDGCTVACGQEILEIETEKVTHTITAPAGGVLRRLVAPGQVVPVLTPLGRIGEVEQAAERPPIQASPIARRLAAENKIDLTTLAGTGPGGRIVEADVNAAIRRVATATPAGPKILETIPLTGTRGTIARRIKASLESTAQLSMVREVDASALVAVRQALLAREAELGARVPYDALLAKALAAALAEQPRLNSSMRSEGIVIYRDVNVGVALAAQAGLVVPVVPDVPSRSLADISCELAVLKRRAQAGGLSEADVANGTVTLTNLGPFGVDIFTPILNPPQSAILGVGRIAARPTVVDDALAVRPTVHLCLTWDHCVADGADAAGLLARIAGLITDAGWLGALA